MNARAGAAGAGRWTWFVVPGVHEKCPWLSGNTHKSPTVMPFRPPKKQVLKTGKRFKNCKQPRPKKGRR